MDFNSSVMIDLYNLAFDFRRQMNRLLLEAAIC
jgi:hypothetical protein